MVSATSRKDKAFDVANTAFLALITLLVIYPLIYIVSASFSSPEAVSRGEVVLLPVEPSLKVYEAVFAFEQVWVGYGNSLFYAVFGTTLNVMLTIMAAFPLSRKEFFGRRFFTFYFAFTMFFSGGLIPTYLVVRSLGLLNTRAAMIIPTAIAVWNVIITRAFMQATIPDTLIEAARMDGASNFYLLFKVVVPLSKPVIAVITLFYAVSHWNEYFQALIYLRDPEKQPLQIVLRNILVANQNAVDERFIDVDRMMRQEDLQALLRYSLIIVASIPVLVIYPFVQRYFVRGIMIGAIKG
jgi:multiple sugar transport system permease protein/putative aldouronate transport system permease protein